MTHLFTKTLPMRRLSDLEFSPRHLLCYVLAAGLALPTPSIAVSVALATKPLANSSIQAEILPNLMVIFDDSASMAWDYLPDWGVNTATNMESSWSTPNLHKNSAYNAVFYDPAVTYSPPVFYDTTGALDTGTYLTQDGSGSANGADTSQSMPNWRKVKVDAYGILGATPTSILFLSDGTATNVRSNVLRRTYYTVEPGEYCADHELRICILATAPSDSYPYPAPIRWCKTAADATSPNPTAGNCRRVRSSTAPIFDTIRTPAPRESKFTIQSTTAGAVISSIQVNGQQILSAPVTSPTTSNFDFVLAIIDRVNKCNGIALGNCTVAGFAATVPKSAEFCRDATLTDCLQPVPYLEFPDTAYMTEAQERWCDTLTNANAVNPPINTCQAAKTTSFSFSRAKTITITVGKGTVTTPVINPASGATLSYSAPSDLSTNNYPGSKLLRVIETKTIDGANMGTTVAYPYPGLYPGAASVAKAPNRIDCISAYCTGREEMTNFANWYTYYRTRLQTAKTAISRAFKEVDNRYRVGLTSQRYDGYTDGPFFLHIDKYETVHKNKFLNTLFALKQGSETPTRHALAKVGKIFANKPHAGAAADPMQYACQKNYVFIATDGYWNTAAEYSGFATSLNNNLDVGNMDGTVGSVQTPRPKYEGPTSTNNSLADIAKYYSDTDLRSPALGNCTGGVRSDGTTGDVCANDFGIQRLTTFTMGLGVPGLLDYTTDYRTAKSGDYFNLANGYGGVNWPNPVSGVSMSARIDDLWHAAVNSDGIYFSASSVDEIIKGLKTALNEIDKKVGSGAAAATSTLQPVGGDNFSFVASYTTVQWTGNLEARTIDITTGVTSLNAIWCVEDIIAPTCNSPSTIVPVTSGGSTTYNCVSATASLPIPTTCTGTMHAKVNNNSDTRKIYMNVNGTLNDFTYGNVSNVGLNANFNNTFLRNNLSQRSTLSANQLDALNGTRLLAYVRGQWSYDMRPSNDADKRLFRIRLATLGDIVESTSAYIAKPTFSYSDTGYGAFKTAQAGRAGTVYVGANDGMLHAFEATTGIERWAFIPTPVIPNLWRLADEKYDVNHRNFVNGSPVISDIYDGSSWRTILVGGLNAGGRGYYALDITDPTTPTLLWEFTADNDADLGFSYATPVITKLSDGTWVALVTSGYNNGSGSGQYTTTTPVAEIANAPAGSGKGFLFVLNARTGAKLNKVSTNVGTAANPSGLGKMSVWTDDAEKNNLGTYAYSGDLLGNLWNVNLATMTAQKLTNLNVAGLAQPVTTRPELGKLDNKRIVYVGTGKYLEESDLLNTDLQSLYAISDPDPLSYLDEPRGSLMIQQTLTNSGLTRTVTSVPVDLTAKRGWYVDYPDLGERQAIDDRLESSTLISATVVPKNTVCSPDGYSWLNYFNYKTGGTIDATGVAGAKTNSPIVGMNVFYIKKGSTNELTPIPSIVKANDPTPQLMGAVPFTAATYGFSKRKVVWRELIQ